MVVLIYTRWLIEFKFIQGSSPFPVYMHIELPLQKLDINSDIRRFICCSLHIIIFTTYFKIHYSDCALNLICRMISHGRWWCLYDGVHLLYFSGSMTCKISLLWQMTWWETMHNRNRLIYTYTYLLVLIFTFFLANVISFHVMPYHEYWMEFTFVINKVIFWQCITWHNRRSLNRPILRPLWLITSAAVFPVCKTTVGRVTSATAYGYIEKLTEI